MFKKKIKSPLYLALLVAAATASIPLSVSGNTTVVLAQSANPEVANPAVPLPPVPNNTVVRINGSDSMKEIDRDLKQGFEGKYPSTKVETAAAETDAALKEVLDENIDLAAIGRPLTAEEKAQGLVEVPIYRHKIAMVVGPDNPFQGDLTFEQFAQIFRGEIQDWSKVGGPAGKIRFIDRPETSDTRQAFRIYPVFQNAPFETGTNTVKLSEDSTDALVKELGKDGIGYAIVDQVQERQDVRILPMHKILPNDSHYPFSQPLSYAYKGPNPNPSVKAFLCYANTSSYAAASPGQTIVSTSFCSEETVATAATRTAPGPFPWWWVLLPLIGMPLLLWWLRDRGAPPVAAGAVPAARAGRIVLTPRNCQEADAAWEISDADRAALRRQGGENLALRLYDVTDIDLDRQTPHSIQQFDCDERSQEQHLTIPRDDRDYLVEIGYTTSDGRWLPLARSAHAHVPACPPMPIENVGTTGAAAIATGAAAVAGVVAGTRSQSDWNSRIAIIPRDPNQAYVHWDVSPEHKAALQQQGGEKLTLRIHDADNIDLDTQPAHRTQEYACDEHEWEKVVPIPVGDRDYVAEIGYLTNDNRWLRLARSLHTHIPAAKVSETIRTGSAAVAGAGAIATGAVPAARSYMSDERIATETKSQITIVPRNAQEAYVSWEIAEEEKEALKRQGGERLALRVYEVTNLDLDDQPAHSVQQFDVDEREQHRFVPIPASDRDYVAELGYLTHEGHWLSLARSLHTRIPSI